MQTGRISKYIQQQQKNVLATANCCPCPLKRPQITNIRETPG